MIEIREIKLPLGGDLKTAAAKKLRIPTKDILEAKRLRRGVDARRKDNVPVRVTTSMHDLVERASHQNFVPVVDDKNAFIGIITRRAIIQYCQEALFPGD